MLINNGSYKSSVKMFTVFFSELDRMTGFSTGKK